MFSLSVEQVVSIVSKMIVQDELPASVHAEKNLILVHHRNVETTPLEYLAGVYSDKLSSLVENNEKLFEGKCALLGLEVNVAKRSQPSRGKSSKKE